MITDYATLKTSVAAWLNRTDLTSIIPELIADGEARIYNDLRIAAMESSFSEAIASGVVAEPAGLLAWKYLYVDGSTAQKLTRKDPEWIYTNYPTRSGGGKPIFFAREGDTLIFGPYPDDSYTIKGRYYARLAALSDSNTTNWFIVNEPQLLRFAALCSAATYLKNDQRIVVWENTYTAALNRIKKTERDEAFSGSQLSVTAG
ncbi:MAG: hypothetical protein V4858_17215 [Pseudomonadota bacterium]